MKKLLILFFVTILFVPFAVKANTRIIPGVVIGRVMNDFTSQWATIGVTVFVDDDGAAYLRGMSESVLQVRGILEAGDSERFAKALKKGLKWSAIAKKEKMEVTKDLGIFLRSINTDAGNVKLTFFSANQGLQTDIILSMSDFTSEYRKMEVYINTINVKVLLKLVERIPETVKSLREAKKKADLLK